MKTIAIKPAWIITMCQTHHDASWLVIQDGIIQEILPTCPDSIGQAFRYEIPEWGILPGLFNAHCHLEFGYIESPIPATESFVDWIRAVIQFRIKEKSTDPEGQRRRAIQNGIREAWQSGTRFLLDTVTEPWNPDWVQDGQNKIHNLLLPEAEVLLGCSPPIQVEPCVELIDINQTRRRETTQFLVDVANRFPATHVAPHAPYTASAKLVKEWASWANDRDRVLSFHLAESKDEMLWLNHRKGPFEEALRTFRDSDFESNRSGLDAYVDAIKEARRVLIAHGNYLDDPSLEEIASGQGDAVVVHCPRTYEHFRTEGRKCYPLSERKKKGIRHFLGTDSRASNPDLSIWNELCTLATTESEIPMEVLLGMVTSEPAKYFRKHGMGTIAPGQSALLTAIRATTLSPSGQLNLCLPSGASTSLERVLFLRDSST